MNESPEAVDVASWDGDETLTTYHDEVWSAWLHGSVAAVHDAGRLLLLVPMILTPAAIALALRLYRVGSVTVLD
ncbi:MAG: hypothetical protein NTV23_09540 [Propionibacteriales bacterium]|nr:hypothetical protein [Propionibacteriales bacterium]